MSVFGRRPLGAACLALIAAALAACGGGSGGGGPRIERRPNTLPVADAISLPPSRHVQLDGSESDADGDTLSYAWTLIVRPDGSAASLQGGDTVSPTLVTTPGTYTVELVVSDGKVASAPDTVRVLTENTAPVANAGLDRTAVVGETIGSTARLTDVDGDVDYVTLEAPAGSAAALSGVLFARRSIDVPGAYVATLVVNDGTADSAPTP